MIEQQKNDWLNGWNRLYNTDERLKSLSETLLATEGYPRQKFAGKKVGEVNEEKNKNSKEEFKKLFNEKYKESTIHTLDGKELTFESVRFTTNYNRYDIVFLSKEEVFNIYHITNDNWRIYCNSPQDILLDPKDEEILKEMFAYHIINGGEWLRIYNEKWKD